MIQTSKNELKSAYILLKCNKKEHNDCRRIRDALLEKYPNVRRAHTTNVKIHDERWCVAATALVDSADEKKFERGLWSIHTSTKKSIGISNVHLVIDQL